MAPLQSRKSGPVNTPPLIVWNHRWEHDKDPETFFKVLRDMTAAGVAFQLAVCGESFERYPDCFDTAREKFGDQITHWGYLPSRADYVALLQQADLAVSTSRHEFFGISTVEALAAGCDVLLPHRLNYPNLLPPEKHEGCLYTSRSDLKRKLKGRLSDPHTIQPAVDRDWLEQFSGPVVADALDRAVEEMVENSATRA